MRKIVLNISDEANASFGNSLIGLGKVMKIEPNRFKAAVFGGITFLASLRGESLLIWIQVYDGLYSVTYKNTGVVYQLQSAAPLSYEGEGTHSSVSVGNARTIAARYGAASDDARTFNISAIIGTYKNLYIAVADTRLDNTYVLKELTAYESIGSQTLLTIIRRGDVGSYHLMSAPQSVSRGKVDRLWRGAYSLPEDITEYHYVSFSTTVAFSGAETYEYGPVIRELLDTAGKKVGTVNITGVVHTGGVPRIESIVSDITVNPVRGKDIPSPPSYRTNSSFTVTGSVLHITVSGRTMQLLFPNAEETTVVADTASNTAPNQEFYTLMYPAKNSGYVLSTTFSAAAEGVTTTTDIQTFPAPDEGAFLRSITDTTVTTSGAVYDIQATYYGIDNNGGLTKSPYAISTPSERSSVESGSNYYDSFSGGTSLYYNVDARSEETADITSFIDNKLKVLGSVTLSNSTTIATHLEGALFIGGQEDHRTTTIALGSHIVQYKVDIIENATTHMIGTSKATIPNELDGRSYTIGFDGGYLVFGSYNGFTLVGQDVLVTATEFEIDNQDDGRNVSYATMSGTINGESISLNFVVEGRQPLLRANVGWQAGYGRGTLYYTRKSQNMDVGVTHSVNRNEGYVGTISSIGTVVGSSSYRTKRQLGSLYDSQTLTPISTTSNALLVIADLCASAVLAISDGATTKAVILDRAAQQFLAASISNPKRSFKNYTVETCAAKISGLEAKIKEGFETSAIASAKSGKFTAPPMEDVADSDLVGLGVTELQVLLESLRSAKKLYESFSAAIKKAEVEKSGASPLELLTEIIKPHATYIGGATDDTLTLFLRLVKGGAIIRA